MAAVLASPAALAPFARADIWDNSNGTGLWSTAANWQDNTEPTASDDCFFVTPIPGGTAASTITLSAGENARALSFNDSYTLTGGGLTIASALVNVEIAKTATIASGLTMSSGLTKGNGGTLILGGTNTISGTINIAAGEIRVGSNAALGPDTTPVVVNSASSVARLYFTNSMTTGRTITVRDLGTIGVIEPTAVVTLTSGLGAASGTMAITGNGTSTLVLAAASARTTPVQIIGGITRVAHASALGSGAVEIGNNATVEIPAGLTLPKSMTLYGNLAGGAGGNVTVSGVITAGGAFHDPTFRSGANATDRLVIGDGVNDYTGVAGVTVIAGSGTVAIPFANNVSSPWRVDSGTLEVGHASALGTDTSTVEIAAGAMLKLINGITFTRPLQMGNNARLIGTGGAVSSSGAISGGSGTKRIETAAVGDVFTVNSANMGGPVVIAGPGKVVMSGSSSVTRWTLESGTFEPADWDVLGGAFPGVTFSGGILRAGGTLLGSRAVVVTAAGGTIDTNGFDINVGDVTGPGLLTKNAAGNLRMTHIRGGALSIDGGRVNIPSTGSTSTAGTCQLTSLSIAPGGLLDLANNKLIVVDGEVGTWNGSAYTGVMGLVARGYADGDWNGLGGIITSRPDAGIELTALAVAGAADALSGPGMFGGLTVDGNDVLVMYTYAGDANMDGFISGDDYAAIDFNVAIPGASGWYNGDFNYDGIISGDDYATIDFNIAAQGAPFRVSGSMNSQPLAVPEPSCLGAMSAAVLALVARNRRRER